MGNIIKYYFIMKVRTTAMALLLLATIACSLDVTTVHAQKVGAGCDSNCVTCGDNNMCT
jgi:hypothetical protein